MMRGNRQSGFTAVELLITLFVAAAFLIAAYQLFNVVIRDGGLARGETRAGNVAYDYLRRYAGVTTNPCTASTPLSNYGINVSGLTNTAVTVAVTCPYSATTTMSKIEATITYNNPQETVTYSTYSYGETGGASSDVLQGLIAWWPFNGNANTSVGNANGTVSGAAPTTGQNGQPNNAYSFNGSNAYISIPGTWGGASTTAVTVSAWYRVAATSGDFQAIVAATDAAFIHMQVYSTGNNAVYINTGSILTTITPQTVGTWNHLVMTSTSGVTAIYLNGVQQGSTLTTTFANITATSNLQIGRGYTNVRYFNGSIDDVRIYSRALSVGEVTTLYTNGAK